MPSRKVLRSIHEKAGDAAHEIAKTAYARSRRERKKVEMLFGHLTRILRLEIVASGTCKVTANESSAEPEAERKARAQRLKDLQAMIPGAWRARDI